MPFSSHTTLILYSTSSFWVFMYKNCKLWTFTNRCFAKNGIIGSSQSIIVVWVRQSELCYREIIHI